MSPSGEPQVLIVNSDSNSERSPIYHQYFSSFGKQNDKSYGQEREKVKISLISSIDQSSVTDIVVSKKKVYIGSYTSSIVDQNDSIRKVKLILDQK